MKFLKDIAAVFHAPTPETMAVQELQDARRALLQAYSAQEYATALVQFNQDRVSRLSMTVKEGAR